MISSAPTPSELPQAAARTLLFRVGNAIYGADIDAVREVVPYRRPTRLPGAPPQIQGLMNLRGTIVTVVDLGVHLDPDRQPARAGSILVAEADTRLAGIVVDEVLDVRAVGSEASPDTAATRDGVVSGLGHSAEQVVILIDVPALVKHVLL